MVMKRDSRFIIILMLMLLPGFLGSCFRHREIRFRDVTEVETENKISDLEKIREAGKLKVVTEYNSISYFIYRGQPMGFQYQMLQELANHLELELDVSVNNNLEENFEHLAGREVDLIAMNLTVTADRKDQFNFTLPLLQTRQVLVQRKPKNWEVMNSRQLESWLLRNQLELAGKTVYVQAGSVYASRLRSLSDEIGGGIDIREVQVDSEQLVHQVAMGDIDYAVNVLSANDRANLKEIFLDTVLVKSKKSFIAPKSPAQKEYIDAIRSDDIVFGIGPAGTGKTYLAMAMAVEALTKGRVNRIILTRPAVEAGEALGFLPGDLAEKVDPYLRPLYDALHDMMRYEKVASLMHQGVIEVAPIAFMRGRTLNDSFIILDEAQNTTSEQMKMFLTRIGYSSKAVITGDITQIDLPAGRVSGLIETKEILQGIEGIRFVYFTKSDVVRHRLVQNIINAYEELEIRKKSKREAAE